MLAVDDDKDKAAEAVTMATAASHDPTPNVSDWKASDVENWLLSNHLQHLQTWYMTSSVVNSI